MQAHVHQNVGLEIGPPMITDRLAAWVVSVDWGHKVSFQRKKGQIHVTIRDTRDCGLKSEQAEQTY
jgi:hypothetical protein